MLVNDHYILNGTEPVPEPDLLTWARWYETAERHVDDTQVTPEVRVSTIFLGLDHQLMDGPPLLFETMIFGGERDQEMWRYRTWQEAEEGHRVVVAVVRAEARQAPSTRWLEEQA